MGRTVLIAVMAMGLWAGGCGKPAPKERPSQPYVAGISSQVYHLADCGHAKRQAPDKLVGFDTIAQATDQGYRPCKSCLAHLAEPAASMPAKQPVASVLSGSQVVSIFNRLGYHQRPKGLLPTTSAATFRGIQAVRVRYTLDGSPDGWTQSLYYTDASQSDLIGIHCSLWFVNDRRRDKDPALATRVDRHDSLTLVLLSELTGGVKPRREPTKIDDVWQCRISSTGQWEFWREGK